MSTRRQELLDKLNARKQFSRNIKSKVMNSKHRAINYNENLVTQNKGNDHLFELITNHNVNWGNNLLSHKVSKDPNMIKENLIKMNEMKDILKNIESKKI
jgi:hypothetical protein